ncbi:MAG: S8 family serine peptidase, partial [Candidatus Thorarchaeota archaeon]|nr:S8 family serine peptidase [Candidatus Thorarchaeota archaeon]
PGCTAGVLSVGASTSYSYLDYLLGPGQEHEGIASFSSKGPTFLGYSKPDVLAPGLAAYAPVPLYPQYFQEWWQSPIWNWGEYSNITLFSGTSQSAPVAAGAAALVMEALNTRGVSWTPDRVKTIIQSTSDSLGYDPATEGFGRINVDAACDFAENDAGFIVESTDSFDTMMSVLEDAWYPERGGEIWELEMPNSPLPTGYAEGSLYFGLASPGSTTSNLQNIYTSATGSYLTDLTGWTSNAYYWRAAEIHTFSSTTFVYNDTSVSERDCYGWYDLRTELGTTEYDAATTAHTYVTVGVSFDDADIADNGAPWMFMYDWTDDNPIDGVPNYWNSATTQGDELKRLTSASDDSNNNIMSYATFGSSLDASLNGDLTLVIHDPKFDTDWAATGNDFQCTVIFWEAVPTSMIQDTGGMGGSTFNWTLTAPMDDAGIYQGFIAITDGATNINVPWSFNLIYNLTASEGAVNTITSGFGSELTPYDSPFYGCVDEGPDDYDFRSYTVYNPNPTARYIGVRGIWDDPGSEMQVFLFDHQGIQLGSQAASTDTSTALLTEIQDPYTGYYHILVYPLSLTGQLTLPANYTLNVMWYTSIDSPMASPTYYSNWDSTPLPFTDYNILEGDHIIANVSLSEISALNLPEYAITSTTMQMFSGIYVERNGNLIIPDGSYNPFDGSPLHLDEFVWEVVVGIKEGDTVRIEVDFTNGDSDIFVYWADTDDSTWSSGNDLASGSMGTGARPEHAEFIASRDGSLAIGIFDYDLAPGNYYLSVDTRESIDIEFSGLSAWYDTYEFGKNTTRSITVIGTTPTGVEFYFDWADVTFNNYFSPDVTVTSPNGGETWTSSHSITWSISSLNDDSEPMSEVWISNDDGLTFMLLARGLDVSSFVWDPVGWQNMDTYRIRVIASDRGMFGEDTSDTSFTAGTLSAPDVPPIIFGSPDLEYYQGDTGNDLTWVVSDLYPDAIELWIDGTFDATYPWNTPSATITE